MSIDINDLIYKLPPDEQMKWQNKYIKKINKKIRRYILWQFLKSKMKADHIFFVLTVTILYAGMQYLGRNIPYVVVAIINVLLFAFISHLYYKYWTFTTKDTKK